MAMGCRCPGWQLSDEHMQVTRGDHELEGLGAQGKGSQRLSPILQLMGLNDTGLHACTGTGPRQGACSGSHKPQATRGTVGDGSPGRSPGRQPSSAPYLSCIPGPVPQSHVIAAVTFSSLIQEPRSSSLACTCAWAVGSPRLLPLMCHALQ